MSLDFNYDSENQMKVVAHPPITQLQPSGDSPLQMYLRGAVTPNNSWQRVEREWQSSHQHPCSDRKLGEFLGAETRNIAEDGQPAIFSTMFVYEHGYLIWNNHRQWKEYYDAAT